MVPPLLLVSLAFAVAVQEPAAGTPPKKGDTIVVKGCLRGGALESTETGLADSADGRTPTAHVYRLTGDKKLLKEMRQEHDGRLVEATGVLKSNLPADDGRGLSIGNTRVRIGVGSPHAGSQAPQPTRAVPVLEVRSYEGVPVKCGG